jgi:spermidine/putrescine transport system substrate-binding protein
MPINKKASLSGEQKKILRWNEQQAYLKNAQLYPAPSAELDAKMQEVWTEMLQK